MGPLAPCGTATRVAMFHPQRNRQRREYARACSAMFEGDEPFRLRPGGRIVVRLKLPELLDKRPVIGRYEQAGTWRPPNQVSQK